MSVTEYRLEELLLYEELEKLREELTDEELIEYEISFSNARRIEKLMKEISRYIRRAKKLWRIYK